MTYLFLVIALGLIHGISTNSAGITAIITTLLLLLTFILESNFLYRRQSTKEIMYDKISLTAKCHRQALIEDLQERTGLRIIRVEVEKLDFLRDMAYLRVYYYE